MWPLSPRNLVITQRCRRAFNTSEVNEAAFGENDVAVGKVNTVTGSVELAGVTSRKKDDSKKREEPAAGFRDRFGLSDEFAI